MLAEMPRVPILLDAAVSGSATQHILLARSICSAFYI
jgi:hypothetical protein